MLSLAEGDLLGAPLETPREVSFKGTVQMDRSPRASSGRQPCFLSAAADAARVSTSPPHHPPICSSLGVWAVGSDETGNQNIISHRKSASASLLS